MGIIMPTERELTHGKIIRDTVGLGAQLKFSKEEALINWDISSLTVESRMIKNDRRG